MFNAVSTIKINSTRGRKEDILALLEHDDEGWFVWLPIYAASQDECIKCRKWPNHGEDIDDLRDGYYYRLTYNYDMLRGVARFYIK